MIPNRVSIIFGWALTRPALAVFFLALAVRLAFAVASFVLNPVRLIPDELQYLELAERVASGRSAESWFPGYGQSLYDAMRVFVVPIRVLFDLFGPSRLWAQLWVVAFGAATAGATTSVARRAVGPRWALASGVVVALMPSQVLWSSVVLREAMVWTCLAVIGMVWPWWLRNDRSSFLSASVVVGIAMLTLGFLRPQTLIVASAALVATALLVRGGWWRERVATVLLLVVVTTWVAGLGIGGVSFALERAGVLGSTRTKLALDADSAFVPRVTLPRTATSVQPGSPPPGSGGPGKVAPTTSTTDLARVIDQYNQEYDVDNSASASIRQLPRGLAAVLVRPLLWEQTSSISLRVAAAENLVWYALYPLAAVGLWASRQRRDVYAYPVLVGIGIVFLSAITQGNLGTAFRHRGQVLWVVALLATQGAVVLVARWRDRSAT